MTEFKKVNKPEFIQHFEISEPLMRATQFGYGFEKRIASIMVENFENVILEKIVEIGKEADVTDLILFNKKSIADALKKAQPKEVFLHSCPICGKHYLRDDFNYCPECGQRLVWGDSDGWLY